VKYFRLEEFDCTHTGLNEMDPDFLERLDFLREECGFPFRISSGYRHETHPNERRKSEPGTHNKGIAADILVKDGFERMNVVHNALKMGFGGIGVAKTFVHVDARKTTPVMWTYS